MLHGAVDDYLRLIKFLQWFVNNKTMTATTLFDYPLEMYSLPSTARNDKKGEITLI